MPEAIEVEGLTKSYGREHRGHAAVLAVDHVSFEIRQGEIFGFLGPNGAGKTTTIRICTGLSKPTSGEVRIVGFNINDHPIRVKERIGVVSDVSSLYGEMSIWDNLEFVAELHGLQKAKRVVRIAELLQSFDLHSSRHSKVATLSTGLWKRLTIAAALVHKPDVLFLDEPTTGLDVQSARSIRQLIKHLGHEGKTVFVTTHYIEEADQLCDRVAIINKGKIVTIGPPEELKRMGRREHVLEVFCDGEATELAQRHKGRYQINNLTVSGGVLKFPMEDASAVLPALCEVAEE